MFTTPELRLESQVLLLGWEEELVSQRPIIIRESASRAQEREDLQSKCIVGTGLGAKGAGRTGQTARSSPRREQSCPMFLLLLSYRKELRKEPHGDGDKVSLLSYSVPGKYG